MSAYRFKLTLYGILFATTLGSHVATTSKCCIHKLRGAFLMATRLHHVEGASGSVNWRKLTSSSEEDPEGEAGIISPDWVALISGMVIGRGIGIPSICAELRAPYRHLTSFSGTRLLVDPAQHP